MKNINTMPLHSRVWVYQSSRLLLADEVKIIQQKSAEFIAQWTSHNNHMDACIEVLHNCFVVVLVDERTAPASGCGIDKSVRFIQNLENDFHLSLLERTNVAYRDERNNMTICSMNEFEELMNAGIVNDNTIVFNNLVSTKGEMENNWEIPVKDSWHARLLKHI